MKVPTPNELGLPEKFSKWRANQEDAISTMVTNTKRVTGLSKPTGSGKSVDYVAAALIINTPTCFVTQNLGLQKQLMDDFESIGMVELKGRSNYSCRMKPEYTCNDGYAARCSYKGSMMCPYSKAETKASLSSLVVTNYDKWMTGRRNGTTGFNHIQHVVFDEGHSGPAMLAKALQVTLGHKIEDDLGIDFLDSSEAENFEDWKSWSIAAYELSKEKLKEVQHQIECSGDPKPAWLKQYNHFKNLTRQLGLLSTARSEDWIVDQVEEGYQFDPIRPRRYSEGYLLMRVPKITVISATNSPKTLFMMGIGQQQMEFKEYDSDFDPNLCPIYYIPTQSVDAKHPDTSMLWMRFDQIASKRRDRNGIVHTISYSRREDIVNRSRYASSMIFNNRGESASKAVSDYKNTYPGAILVGPTFGTGFDFPGRECEWQFITKIPFPDSRSKIMKARQKDDREYGAHYAMQYLRQAIGRGARSNVDPCENFICDDNMVWFMRAYGHLATGNFHRFYRPITTLPPAPKRLGA